MKIIDVMKNPGRFSAEYTIEVSVRDIMALHHLERRPMIERDFAGLIKKLTKGHHRVRWARKARRKRRALGV